MRISLLVTVLRFAALLALGTPALLAQTSDVAVVVNPKNAVASLSISELRKLFAGETRTWPDGVPVQLITRAPGAHERQTVLHLLQMSEDDYVRYWTTQAYRGEGTEPVAVFSNGMQKEAVVAIPGAIALMDVADIKPGLKVVKIEGKLPGERGYPLH